MTNFLFARPSAAEGIGRNIDLFGVLNYYNTSKTEREADLRAMKDDLEILKRDFDIAYKTIMTANDGNAGKAKH